MKNDYFIGDQGFKGCIFSIPIIDKLSKAIEDTGKALSCSLSQLKTNGSKSSTMDKKDIIVYLSKAERLEEDASTPLSRPSIYLKHILRMTQ